MREDRFIVIALLLLFQAELFSCSRNHNTVMVEFEIPFKKRGLTAAWRNGFVSFVQYLLSR